LEKSERLYDRQRIALAVKGFRLERLVHAAEWHHPGFGTKGAEKIGGDLAARRADLEPCKIAGAVDRPRAGRDVVKPVLPRATEGVEPGRRDLTADLVAERTVERREHRLAVAEDKRHQRQGAGRCDAT